MRDRSKLREMLIEHEGLRHEMYKCSQGYNTIGVGHNLDTNPLSYNVIMVILEDDIWQAERECRKYSFWNGLDDVRKDALTDLMFNLGANTFAKFKKMIAALNEGDFDKAADELLDSRYATQVGKRAQTIARMIREGVY